jgi:hypothetical protein
MPFVITDGTTLAKADNALDALRVCSYPAELTTKYLLTMYSGALTGVAAGTANPVFAFRQIDSASVIVVKHIGIGWVTTTGYTAAQYQDFAVVAARSYTVSSSGGTAWSGASDNGCVRTSFSAPTNVDVRIANTAALTAGTFTADGGNIVLGQAGCYNAAGTAGGYIPPSTSLVDFVPGDYPLVLAQNEGFIIYPVTAMGAAGVGTLTVNVEFLQTASY